MQINKHLTKINFENVNNTNRIKYIVIHYVGATGDAKANCKYFYSTYRGASAHYFVGHNGDVWQCVADGNIAWHCGARAYRHNDCRNSNSIGIELCCRKNSNGNWYFEEATVKAAIELTKELMKKYNIPAERVLRHYDVTGKVCPEPYVRNVEAWRAFKSALAETANNSSFGIKINCSALNIRAGVGIDYRITGVIRDRKTYTIVEVKNGWGKLKSGLGWINLRYTERV